MLLPNLISSPFVVQILKPRIIIVIVSRTVLSNDLPKPDCRCRCSYRSEPHRLFSVWVLMNRNSNQFWTRSDHALLLTLWDTVCPAVSLQKLNFIWLQVLMWSNLSKRYPSTIKQCQTFRHLFICELRYLWNAYLG